MLPSSLALGIETTSFFVLRSVLDLKLTFNIFYILDEILKQVKHKKDIV